MTMLPDFSPAPIHAFRPHADHPAAVDLRPLFSPASIAFVGASEQPKKRTTRIFQYLLGSGYAGRIYPVAEAPSVFGHRAFPSVSDLPERPDHVGVLVSPNAVLDVLGECARMGVPVATVFSEGFAETGTEEGKRLQDQILELTHRTGLRVLGPNCNGVINYVQPFAFTATTSLDGGMLPPGNVGIVSQSAGLGQINVMRRAQEAGLGISYQASCGNEGDIDTLDCVRFMLRSETTDVVLLALESIKDGAKLREVAAEALELEKPIVVLKYGRTDAGSRAAASHSGAIAGSDDICDAAFRQFGLIRVEDCNQLYEAAVLLRQRRWPAGRRLSSVSSTGGNVAHVADIGEDQGFVWKDYSAETQARLGALLSSKAPVANPTDMSVIARDTTPAFYQALDAILGDPGIDALVPGFVNVKRGAIEHAADYAARQTKPIALLWVGGCTDDPAFGAADLIRSGAAVYRDVLPCMKAMNAAASFGEHAAAAKRGDDLPMRPDGIDPAGVAAGLSRLGGLVGEREAKDLLASCGFAVTRERLATSAAQAVAVAREIGFPVALKIDSPQITHKTEVGGVRLGLPDDSAVESAFDEIVQSVRQHAPDAAINGVLVQEMIPPGIEMVLGIVNDPSFGPVVMAGLGGIHVEVLRDVSFRVAPISRGEAAAMIDELRARALLDGVRGAPPRDIESIVDQLVRLSWLAYDQRGDIEEMDINPLIVLPRGEGARVADALIVRRRNDDRSG